MVVLKPACDRWKFFFGFVLLLSGAFGCGRDGDGSRKFNLIVSGVDFQVYNDSNVFTALTIAGSTAAPNESSAIISDDGWEVYYRSVLTQDISYQLYYFVDDNSNGLCDAPPEDPGWIKTIDDFTGQVRLEVSVNEEQDDPCKPFQAI